MTEKNKIINLGRGGTLIQTEKIGGIQVGIPPETIKDCMKMGIPIPNYYVFPKELFDREIGVNVAEAEFPAYFNFFIMKKVVCFICTQQQEKNIRQVFQETLLGPKEIDLKNEIKENFPENSIPDLAREGAYIRTFHTIDELFTFTHFGADGIARLPNGVEVRDLGDEFGVFEDGIERGRAPAKVKLPASIWQGSVIGVSQQKFDPPLFGATIIGSGHGFDPARRTSGFVLWLNKRGIMVDPPLNSREVLQSRGVPSRLVDTVIITHCHADHDQGTLQKILEESQVTVITTPTILGSFLRKYSALTGLTEDFLRRLFVFRPVMMGEPMKINGGELRFFYSIHTIPCIGFEVYYSGKSIYFSGDTCYDPKLISKMQEEGIIRKGRAEHFLNNKWHHNVILHEAGVPPIHTPVSVLATFDDDIKKRMYLYHTSQKAVPEETGLRIAPEGVENTIVIDVTPHIHAEAIELLTVVDSIDMFPIFTLSQARELLQCAVPRHYKEGSLIIEQGTRGNEFYIITGGVVQLSGDNWSKNIVVGDYFGEMSLLLGSTRTASAIAKTDVDIISFTKEDFLSIIRGNTETIEFLLNLSQRRAEPSWQIICSNIVFNRMTNAQKTRLQAYLYKKEIKKGDLLWSVGDPANHAYLVGSGLVKFEGKTDLEPFGCGAFLGEINSILSGKEKRSTSLVALTDGWGYTISRKDLIEIFDHYPGIKLCFLDTNFIDTIKEEELRARASSMSHQDFSY